MPKQDHDLPDGAVEWVAETMDGRVSNLSRHVARREAWVVDVERPDGSIVECFLRLERGAAPSGVGRLERETRIVEALGRTDVPVPAVYGWHDELRLALFQRDPGRSDIDLVQNQSQQRAVMEDFVRVMARFHALDLDQLDLDSVMDARPTTPTECGLAEIDRAQSQWGFFLNDYVDPLTTFGVDWLHRNVPQNVARISLVQGDTGPVNFMFQEERVSSVIDWELGHFGDPMEDLGSLCLREFWNPSGGLEGLFELYERESGIPYDRHAVQFHRVRQNVRDMMPIHYLNAHPMPRESLAWYLCYRYLADRATIEAIAETVGVTVEKPDLPDDSAPTNDVLAIWAVDSLLEDVRPDLEDGLAQSRLLDTTRLIRCIDRRSRFGPELEETERREIGQLLNSNPVSAAEAFAALDTELEHGRIPDDAAITYLARKAYRDEWLHGPALELYPDRVWSPID